MKKLLFIGGILFMTSIQAQTKFGIKAGYNLSNLKWEPNGFDDYKFDSYSYFYVGGLAEHALSEKLAIQGEILYTELGGSQTETLTDIVGNEVIEIGTNIFTITTSQIQIPMSLKYSVIPKLSLSGGFNFGFNVSSKVESSFNYPTVPNGKVESFKTLNIFPFIGSEFKISDNFFADARYHFNFFNTAKENALPTQISFLQVGLGYRFK